MCATPVRGRPNRRFDREPAEVGCRSFPRQQWVLAAYSNEGRNGYHLDHPHWPAGWDHCEVPASGTANEPSGFVLTAILGIIGAIVASYLGQWIGWYRPGEGAGFIGAVVGAIIILVIWGFFARRRPAV